MCFCLSAMRSNNSEWQRLAARANIFPRGREFHVCSSTRCFLPLASVARERYFAATRRGGRAVYCTGLENRRGESLRGFESHPLRHFAESGHETLPWDENAVRAGGGCKPPETGRCSDQSHPLRHFAESGYETLPWDENAVRAGGGCKPPEKDCARQRTKEKL